MSEHKFFYNLIIGLSGPYGSGCSSLAEEIVRIINDWPGCTAYKIPVSLLIELWQKRILGTTGVHSPADNLRRENLQKVGTRMRNIDPEIIGKLVTNEIVKFGEKLEKEQNQINQGTLIFVVDSIKNYNDLKSLRKIYKDEFFFCFINANNEIRWRRMRDYKGWKEKDKSKFQELDDIDSNERQIDPNVGDAGQQVKKLAAHADYYFVNNVTRETFHSAAYRFLCLLFGLGINQPRNDEKCMHLAFSSANNSACLSRQVGAAIFTTEGNILAVGHNDVPKSSGGLYSIEDEHDHRCLNVGDRRCINDTNKEERFNNLQNDLFDNLKEYFSTDQNHEDIKEIIMSTLEKSEFKDATEYCRAVHAEMDALISVCRNLSGSTIGSTVYVTTQPCHNCTKHLICAGVKRVVYIEPYPKSLGEELHSDAIRLNPQSGNACEEKIVFLPYEGVAPRRYHDIFNLEVDEKRKDKDGKMCYKDKLLRALEPKFSKKVQKRSRVTSANKHLITINEFIALDELNQIPTIQEK